MIWNNYIGTDYLIPSEICEHIINVGENKLNSKFGASTKDEFRIDQAVPFLESFASYRNHKSYDLVQEAISNSIDNFMDNFAIGRADRESYFHNEHKFQKSKADGGFFSWHYETQGDFFKKINRRFVWMLYLNTVEKGGKTQFFKSKDEDIIEIKPEVGKLVFWPAGETHWHRSAPDLKETKYILTGWVLR